MIGEKVRKRRLELGLTQEELALKMGYKNKSTINRIESNKSDVNQKNLVRLAEALGVSPLYFIEDSFKANNVPRRIMAYYEMFLKLSQSNQESVMKYIDFLSNEESEK